MPEADRAVGAIHGKRGLPVCLSQVISAGQNPIGGRVAAVKIRNDMTYKDHGGGESGRVAAEVLEDAFEVDFTTVEAWMTPSAWVISTELWDSRTLSNEYSPAVMEALRAAGWEPGRFVDVGGWVAPLEDGGLTAHTAARAFLAEFGGLRFVFSGPGVECAREPFLLDPLACEGEEEVFLEWGEELALSLFPIGERAEGVAFLAIDEHGAVISLGGGIATSYGQAPGAFERMLLGYEAEVLGHG